MEIEKRAESIMQCISSIWNTGGCIQGCDYVYIETQIKEIKREAADVQTIRHGRWIDIHEYCKMNGYIPSGVAVYYWCSECMKEQEKTSNFCPNCGARMDGEQNEV